jgi:hypothetical protein|tara:strand:+ start:5998 stop:6186 length:189 start_codon:yes stop_codon:yes gene_type:complete
MAKHEWNVTKQKQGTEIYVSNAYKSIYIGENDEHTTEKSIRMTILVAHICKNALNKDNPYDK